jgi:hypothetical protein
VEYLQALIDSYGLKKVDVNLKKGQALIWSANLLHGGSAIKDRTRSRHSQVTHYFFEGCLYYTPLLSDLPIGKAYARSIRNIATGETVGQAYNRVPVTNPGQWLPVLPPVEERPALAAPAPHPVFLARPYGSMRSRLEQVRSTVARMVGLLT